MSSSDAKNVIAGIADHTNRIRLGDPEPGVVQRLTREFGRSQPSCQPALELIIALHQQASYHGKGRFSHGVPENRHSPS